MFCICLADEWIGIEHQYPDVEALCKAYRGTPPFAPLFTACVTQDDILAEQNGSDPIQPVTPGYAESVCLYRAICKELLRLRGIFLLHGAVIEYEGKGYLFAAPSGVGKSTHALLWRKHFGSRVHMVNGDKPLLKFQKDTLLAYGTPWCGKEGWGENTSVPIHGICFLMRAKENAICLLSPQEAASCMMSQILLPSEIAELDQLCTLIDQTVRSVPCYRLECNPTEEAAQVAYDGMNSTKRGKA